MSAEVIDIFPKFKMAAAAILNPRTSGSYDGTHGTPRYDRCNPRKGGVH